MWTDAYDTYIEDMEKCDSSVNILKDKDEKKHLSINAGLPICKLNINYSIDIPLKFSDNKDHYVWIKTSTFSPTIDPQNDLNCITNFDKIMNNGVIDNTLLNTSLRCVKVPAGRTVTVTTKKMNKNCYIFLKWSLTNNSCAGGGTFMPPQQVTIETTT